MLELLTATEQELTRFFGVEPEPRSAGAPADDSTLYFKVNRGPVTIRFVIAPASRRVLLLATLLDTKLASYTFDEVEDIRVSRDGDHEYLVVVVHRAKRLRLRVNPVMSIEIDSDKDEA